MEIKVIYIYILPRIDIIIRLLHPPSRDSQGQETFLEPSADNCKSSKTGQEKKSLLSVFACFLIAIGNV